MYLDIASTPNIQYESSVMRFQRYRPRTKGTSTRESRNGSITNSIRVQSVAISPAMFRKKKIIGSVTVFDETDQAAANKFNDLSLHTAGDDSEDLDKMTTQQLRQLAIGSAQAGKDSTARALKIANEAREIGVNTAETLQGQTEHLEKLGDEFEVVHDYLDKSERKCYFHRAVQAFLLSDFFLLTLNQPLFKV